MVGGQALQRMQRQQQEKWQGRQERRKQQQQWQQQGVVVGARPEGVQKLQLLLAATAAQALL
jgi:hypothetical protein